MKDLNVKDKILVWPGFENLDLGVNPESIYLKTIKGRWVLLSGRKNRSKI